MQNEQNETRLVSKVSEAQKRAVRKYYEKRKETEEYKQNNINYQKKYYENNKQKVLEYKKQYYLKKKQQSTDILLPDILV